MQGFLLAHCSCVASTIMSLIHSQGLLFAFHLAQYIFLQFFESTSHSLQAYYWKTCWDWCVQARVLKEFLLRVATWSSSLCFLLSHGHTHPKACLQQPVGLEVGQCWQGGQGVPTASSIVLWSGFQRSVSSLKFSFFASKRGHFMYDYT